MHLTSTINQLSKSEGSVPVAVVCFNEKRKFIRVSDDYEDTVARAKTAFRIDQNTIVRLATSALNVCQGKKVVIDESAYPFMWTVLDELHICLEDETPQVGAPRNGKAREALPTPASEEHYKPFTSNGSDFKEPDKMDWDDIYGHTESERERGAVSNFQSQGSSKNGGEVQGTPKRSYENIRGNGEDKEEGGSKRTKFKPVSNAVRNGDTTPPMSSFDTTDDFATVTPSSPIDLMAGMRVKQEKNIDRDFTATPRPDKSPRKAAQNLGLPDDPRFEITIYGVSEEQRAQFKTKGKHPVRKVLAAACKSFGIPYDRANLLHVVAVDGEEHEFELNEEETMAMCGVNANSKLRISVSEDDEDGEEYDE